MAKKIVINGNYTVITDSVTSEIEYEVPTSEVRYVRQSNGYIKLYEDGDNRYLDNVIQIKEDNFIDSGDTPIADIYDWLQTNTGA